MIGTSIVKELICYVKFTQQSFTYLKLKIEKLKKLWNMFEVNNKDTRPTPFPGVSITDFEQINVS